MKIKLLSHEVESHGRSKEKNTEWRRQKKNGKERLQKAEVAMERQRSLPVGRVEKNASFKEREEKTAL